MKPKQNINDIFSGKEKEEIEKMLEEKDKNFVIFSVLLEKFKLKIFYLINAPTKKYIFYDYDQKQIISQNNRKEIVKDFLFFLKSKNIDAFSYEKKFLKVIDIIAEPIKGFCYRPDKEYIYRGKLNLFHPSFYMKNWRKNGMSGDFENINKFLQSFFESKKEYEYFLNRLAFNFQTPKEKVPTSIILLGIPGTGKDTLKELLKKILGSNMAVINASHLLSHYNAGYIANKLYVFANEVMELRQKSQISNLIKDITTNKTIRVEEKFVPSYEIENLSNWIFATNNFKSVPLEKKDRRYSIFIQTKTLEEKIGKEAIDKLYTMFEAPPSIDDEFMHFYDFLMSYEVDKEKVFKPLENNIRKDLLELYKGSFENKIEEVFKDYYYSDDKECIIEENKDSIYIVAPKFYKMFEDKFGLKWGKKKFYLELKQHFLMEYAGVKTIRGKNRTWLKILDKSLKEKVMEYL